MTVARSRQLCLELTPYYHCITRCVRRSFLCGKDKQTKKNFNHRRHWIEERLLFLSSCFCIDVAGYAVMSNHYHVVVKVDQEKAKSLTDDEVMSRWLQLYKGTALAQRYQAGEALTAQEQVDLNVSIKLWRSELSNLSRFMGNLNEHIARKANKEDNCRGRFWESRFVSQALLDLAALLRTLCYVDLNPVRAKLAKTPEQSKYTSIYRRLRQKSSGLTKFQTRSNVAAESEAIDNAVIPIKFTEYLSLLEWTGRQKRKDKPGSIDPLVPDIVDRLGYTPDKWQSLMIPHVNWKQKALGSANRLRAYCDAMGQRWIWGVSSAVGWSEVKQH